MNMNIYLVSQTKTPKGISEYPFSYPTQWVVIAASDADAKAQIVDRASDILSVKLMGKVTSFSHARFQDEAHLVLSND